jgi:hypothetical protein
MLAKDAKYDFSKGAAVLGAAQAELVRIGEEKEGEGNEAKGERIYLNTIIEGITGDFETFSGRMSLVMPGPCPRQPLESSNFADEKNKFEDEAKRYSHDFNIGAAKANAICESAAKDYEIWRKATVSKKRATWQGPSNQNSPPSRRKSTNSSTNTGMIRKRYSKARRHAGNILIIKKA